MVESASVCRGSRFPFFLLTTNVRRNAIHVTFDVISSLHVARLLLFERMSTFCRFVRRRWIVESCVKYVQTNLLQFVRFAAFSKATKVYTHTSPCFRQIVGMGISFVFKRFVSFYFCSIQLSTLYLI